MKIAFLYPGKSGDSLTEWVNMLSRYCTDEVVCIPKAHQAEAFDMVFAITQYEVYPEINTDLEHLRACKVPYGVVHNHDNGRVKAGKFPSFVWTQTAMQRLPDYNPMLVRQPVLPRYLQFPSDRETRALHLGTFGSIEQKKWTFAMARHARYLGIPFSAFVPDVLANREDMGAREVRLWKAYIESVRQQGAEVVIRPWFDTVEQLGPLLEEVSHLVFVLPPSKEGSGGSCTSPRCASAFARPVIVVDDEWTFAEDGYYVYPELRLLTRQHLEDMQMPSTAWGPDEYVKTLVRLTKEFGT